MPSMNGPYLSRNRSDVAAPQYAQVKKPRSGLMASCASRIFVMYSWVKSRAFSSNSKSSIDQAIRLGYCRDSSA